MPVIKPIGPKQDDPHDPSHPADRLAFRQYVLKHLGRYGAGGSSVTRGSTPVTTPWTSGPRRSIRIR